MKNKKENIILAKLYNRLSFYFCIAEEKPEIKISEKTSIKELQEILDEVYLKREEK